MQKKIFIFLVILLATLCLTLFKLNMLESISLISTYFACSVFGLSFYPYLQNLLPGRKELYPVSKLLSLLLFGYIVWVIQFFFHINASLFVYFFAMILLAVHLKKKKSIEHFWSYEIYALIIFIIFLVICSFKPELSWGEKPMDISMMNYLYRQNGVIGEPWFSGAPLRYYYFGYYIFSKYLTIFKLHPILGYHVSLSLVASLFFCISYSLFFKIIGNSKRALFGAFFLLFSSSTTTLFNLFLKKNYDVNFFWSNTRVFKGDLFAEFPLWSFSFSDFHPHVIAYPFLVLMIWMTLDLQKFKGEQFVRFFLLTFIGINLAVINSWDVFFIAPLNVFLVLSLYFKEIFKEKKVQLLLHPIQSTLMCMILYLPLIESMTGATQGDVLHIFRGEHNSLLNLFAHQGLQLIILLLFLAINFDYKRVISKKNLVFLLVSISVILLIQFYFIIPLAISIVSYLLLLLFLSINQKFYEERKMLFPWIVTLLLMYFVAEHFIIFDRINSLFKINNLSYILSSIIVVVLMYSSLKNKIIKNITLGLLSVFIFISIFNIKGITSYSQSLKGLPSLNGKIHLDERAPGDSQLIDFINSSITGTPVLLESFGKAYDYKAGRIQWFTGLSGFLVWSGQHLTQRGVESHDILKKEKRINEIYGTLNPKSAHLLCIWSGIDYIVVGGLERQRYSNNGLNKFKGQTDLYTKVFEDKINNTYLYKVKK